MEPGYAPKTVSSVKPIIVAPPADDGSGNNAPSSNNMPERKQRITQPVALCDTLYDYDVVYNRLDGLE